MKGFYHRNSFAAVRIPTPCWGAALPIAGLVLSAAGTVAGAIGKIGQQNAEAQAASVNAAEAVYRAQVARQNQELMTRQAEEALQRGQVTEEKRRQLAAQQIGQQTAGLAAQGTDLEGSPTDILGDTAAVGELDVRAIKADASREAYGLQIQGGRYRDQSVLEATRAANSTYAPNYWGVGASLLLESSTLADKWRRFQLETLKAPT